MWKTYCNKRRKNESEREEEGEGVNNEVENQINANLPFIINYTKHDYFSYNS